MRLHFFKIIFFFIISTNIYSQYGSLHILYKDSNGIEVNCYYLNGNIYFLSTNAAYKYGKQAGLSSNSDQLCLKKIKITLDTLETLKLQIVLDKFTIHKSRYQSFSQLNLSNKKEADHKNVNSLISLLTGHIKSSNSEAWTKSDRDQLQSYCPFVTSFESFFEEITYDAINFVSQNNQSVYITNQLDLARIIAEIDKGRDLYNSKNVCIPNFIYLEQDESIKVENPEYLCTRITLLYKGYDLRKMYLKGNYLYIGRHLFLKVNGRKLRSLLYKE